MYFPPPHHYTTGKPSRQSLCRFSRMNDRLAPLFLAGLLGVQPWGSQARRVPCSQESMTKTTETPTEGTRLPSRPGYHSLAGASSRASPLRPARRVRRPFFRPGPCPVRIDLPMWAFSWSRVARTVRNEGPLEKGAPRVSHGVSHALCSPLLSSFVTTLRMPACDTQGPRSDTPKNGRAERTERVSHA